MFADLYLVLLQDFLQFFVLLNGLMVLIELDSELVQSFEVLVEDRLEARVIVCNHLGCQRGQVALFAEGPYFL